MEPSVAGPRLCFNWAALSMYTPLQKVATYVLYVAVKLAVTTLRIKDIGITPWHLAATIIGQPVTESHNVSKSVLLIVQQD